MDKIHYKELIEKYFDGNDNGCRRLKNFPIG